MTANTEHSNGMNLKQRNKAKLERIADVATKWIGSTSSLIFHTIIFIISFLLPILHVIAFDKMLLILTTIVSLEAIYLAIFIQMSVNKNSYDIETIQENVEEIQEDIEEIQEDVEDIQEDVEEIQEDVEELQEDDETINTDAALSNADKVSHIQILLAQLQKEIDELKE